MPRRRPFNDPAPVTADEYYADRAARMSETQLQNAIVILAKSRGWLVYHTHDSRRSEAGYPDLHLVHAGQGRQLFRELKNQTRKPTREQVLWLNSLTTIGCDAGLWRPADWFSGRIRAELAAPDQLPVNKDSRGVPRDPWL